MKDLTLLFLLCCLLNPSFILAQTENSESLEKETMEEEGAWELVLSGVNFSHFSEEERDLKGTTFGTEIHLSRWFNPKWSLGVGYTLKFEKDLPNLSELALIGSHRFNNWFTLNLGPNFTLPNSEPTSKLIVSALVEAELNFTVGEGIQIGPLAGFLLEKNSEFFAGAYIAYEF